MVENAVAYFPPSGLCAAPPSQQPITPLHEESHPFNVIFPELPLSVKIGELRLDVWT